MNWQGLAFGVGAFLLIKYAMSSVRDNLANSPLGNANIIRSSAGKDAAANILKLKWLTKSYRDKLLSPNYQYLAVYNVDVIPDEQHVAEIAKMIVDSNFRIFPNDIMDNLAAFGLSPILGQIDKPDQVLNAFSAIKNQVQALQVAWWYNNATGKELNVGVQWLPDAYIIQLNDYLRLLPTGVFPKTPPGSAALTQLPNL